MLIHFRIQVRLRCIDLKYRRIVKHFITLGCERNNQTDIVLLGKIGHRFHLFCVSRTENDIHSLHFRLVQNLLDRSCSLSAIVSIQVNGNTLLLQAIQSHQEAFIIFHHSYLLVIASSTVCIERQHNSSFDGSILATFFLVLVKQFRIGRDSGLYRGLCYLGCIRRLFRIRNTQEFSFLQLLALDFWIGSNQFLFGNAILTTDAINRFFFLHLMHVTTFRLKTLAFRLLYCYLRSRYNFGVSFCQRLCSFLRCSRWDSDYLSDAEILGTQTWIRTANAFSGYPILCGKLIQCFTCLNGMELHLTSISVLRDIQNLTGTDALFTTRIQTDNVINGNIVHG